jgi:hypothetical protein
MYREWLWKEMHPGGKLRCRGCQLRETLVHRPCHRYGTASAPNAVSSMIEVTLPRSFHHIVHGASAHASSFGTSVSFLCHAWWCRSLLHLVTVRPRECSRAGGGNSSSFCPLLPDAVSPILYRYHSLLERHRYNLSLRFPIVSGNMPHTTLDVAVAPSSPHERLATHLTENILTLQQTIRNIREDVANGIAPSILMSVDSVNSTLREC